MKKILIPTDFSENANHALRYAIQMGKYIGFEEIFLLNATTVPVNPGDTLLPVSKILLEDSQKRMQEFLKEVKTWDGAELFTFHVHSSVDDPVAAIIAYAEKIRPDMIIMGSKGASGIGEFLFGTVAASVLEESDIPVWVIPGNISFDKIRSIAFAADLKTLENLDSLRLLKNICIALEAKLQMVHVTKDKNLDIDQSKEKETLLNYFHGIQVQFHSVISENIYTGIEIFMQDANPDVVAVLSRKRNFFDKIFHSSMSKRMAYRTFIPMLSMKEIPF
ncbi:MAG: universal stress protein [Flavobacteriales bacterium]|nr:universal stress protein [Flavobacteriales bacterium]